jgi:HSP20 family protein
MQKKRSFFEKLTGAVTLEEDLNHFEVAEQEPLYTSNVPVEDEETDAQLSVDVYETSTEIVIKTMVAGVKPDDLDVSITRDTVTIHGHREEDRTVSNTDYINRELYWGSFSRTISLPEEIDVEEAEAVEKFGLLIIRMPKLDKHRQTRLKVKGS